MTDCYIYSTLAVHGEGEYSTNSDFNAGVWPNTVFYIARKVSSR